MRKTSFSVEDILDPIKFNGKREQVCRCRFTGEFIESEGQFIQHRLQNRQEKTASTEPQENEHQNRGDLNCETQTGLGSTESLRCPEQQTHCTALDPPRNEHVEENSQRSPSKPKSCKTRRIRTAFTFQQLHVLETRFHSSHYLSVCERFSIASALHLSQTQLKIWFQNRRTKWKKENEGKEKDRSADELHRASPTHHHFGVSPYSSILHNPSTLPYPAKTSLRYTPQTLISTLYPQPLLLAPVFYNPLF
ncbi:homeobox protein pnx-like [Acipenser ruthenus]|uniref:homeobox protein pnx-like n=1 Tax=Acipenser ruthenus TaxID=7906 RepID=UPI002742704A|nr:homeobox protein pnx-like [Acipenser ruthenus]